MRDCQSPNLNSANINFWPPGDHFAKYNSRQIFRLYSSSKRKGSWHQWHIHNSTWIQLPQLVTLTALFYCSSQCCTNGCRSETNYCDHCNFNLESTITGAKQRVFDNIQSDLQEHTKKKLSTNWSWNKYHFVSRSGWDTAGNQWLRPKTGILCWDCSHHCCWDQWL